MTTSHLQNIFTTSSEIVILRKHKLIINKTVFKTYLQHHQKNYNVNTNSSLAEHPPPGWK